MSLLNFCLTERYQQCFANATTAHLQHELWYFFVYCPFNYIFNEIEMKFPSKFILCPKNQHKFLWCSLHYILDVRKKFHLLLNSSPPSAAYMRRWTGPSLVQVMACRLFSAITWTNAGLLSIGLLGTNVSKILIEILSFSFKKMHLKMSSAKMAAILSMGRWVNVLCHQQAQYWWKNDWIFFGFKSFCCLTLKYLIHFLKCDHVFQYCWLWMWFFLWSWSNTMNIWSALWVLMTWCLSTRVSVATVLRPCQCVSSYLWV